MFCCAFRYEPDLEHEPWWPLACTIWWKQNGIYILHYLLHTVILSWNIGPHCLVYQYICIEHQFVVSALFIEPQFWLIFVVALYTKLDNHGNKKLDKIFICKTIIYIHVHISLMLLNFMKSIKKNYLHKYLWNHSIPHISISRHSCNLWNIKMSIFHNLDTCYCL